jgi:Zn-dependent protease
MSGFDWQTALTWFIAFVISSTFHEAAHGLLAKLGGDLTAYRMGQVTLNPMPHIQREPWGMVLLPVISLLASNGQSCIGYASTAVDPFWAYRNPRKAALMSAAGPLSNLLLAVIAFFVLVALGQSDGNSALTVQRIAIVFLRLNLLLFVFNLLPFPPLDGAGVVRGLLPGTRNAFDALQSMPYASILTFVIAIKVVPYLYYPLLEQVAKLLNQWR